MKYIFSDKQMKTLSILLGGVMCILAEACTEPQTDLNKLCGRWKSTTGKPDIGIYKEEKAYKLILFSKKALTGKKAPQTYLIRQDDGGNLYIDTGFHIDIFYHQEKDVITFSTNGDYVRKP